MTSTPATVESSASSRLDRRCLSRCAIFCRPRLGLLAVEKTQVRTNRCVASSSIEFVDSPPGGLALTFGFFGSYATLGFQFFEIAPYRAVVGPQLSPDVARGCTLGMLGKEAQYRRAQRIDTKHGQCSFDFWRQGRDNIFRHLSILYGFIQNDNMPYNVIRVRARLPHRTWRPLKGIPMASIVQVLASRVDMIMRSGAMSGTVSL